MRQQISIDLPKRLGHLIKEGLVEKIMIRNKNSDITIYIKEDDEFVEDHEFEMEHSIHVEIKKG